MEGSDASLWHPREPAIVEAGVLGALWLDGSTVVWVRQGALLGWERCDVFLQPQSLDVREPSTQNEAVYVD